MFKVQCAMRNMQSPDVTEKKFCRYDYTVKRQTLDARRFSLSQPGHPHV